MIESRSKLYKQLTELQNLGVLDENEYKVEKETILNLLHKLSAKQSLHELIHSLLFSSRQVMMYGTRQNKVPVPFSYYDGKTQGFVDETTVELSGFRNYTTQNNAVFMRFYVLQTTWPQLF